MFVDGDRLTGERRLVDLQVAHGCQTQVCRHAVTRFDQHDVAGDESLRRNSSALSVPAHGDLGQNQLREGLDGVLRLALLDIADDRVGEDDPEDYRGINPLAEPGCYSGGRQQDVNEGRVELEQEALPFGRTAASGYLIRTELREPRSSPPTR